MNFALYTLAGVGFFLALQAMVTTTRNTFTFIFFRVISGTLAVVCLIAFLKLKGTL